MWRRRFPPASALALCALALAAGASHANAVSVTEYPLPVDYGSPPGIAAGADGNVRFTLAETLGCRGSVRLQTLARHRVRLGVARFRIGGGQTRAVTIRLTPPARVFLRTRRVLPVAAIVAAVDAAGNRARTVRRLALRAR